MDTTLDTGFVFQSNEELALQVRIERVRHRWTQVDLATRADVSPNDVSRLECRKRVFSDRAYRILAVLGISLKGQSVGE